MKTLGLIGGTTWHSTEVYYRIINQTVHERLGGLNSAKLFLYSVNFQEFQPPSDINKWEAIINILTDVSIKLENAGSDCIVICANTPHLVANVVQEKIGIPLLHIADATAAEIIKQNTRKVGLLGTKFTMEQNFFKDRLLKRKIDVITPEESERDFINKTIFEELGMGIFSSDTKKKYLKITNNLMEKGAEGIIFGCTEIPLLIKPEECNFPVFDTLIIHAKHAVDFVLS